MKNSQAHHKELLQKKVCSTIFPDVAQAFDKSSLHDKIGRNFQSTSHSKTILKYRIGWDDSKNETFLQDTPLNKYKLDSVGLEALMAHSV